MASSRCDRVPDRALPGLPGGLRELDGHLRRHRVPESGRRLILEALERPTRRVGGGKHNVVLRFASRKMGVVIQAESRTLDLAHVEFCEYSPAVLLYVCQPGGLRVPIVDSRGRRTSILYRPDYLVLDATGFWLVECKTIEKLTRDAAKANPRYVYEDGKWRWPAAEKVAAGYGIGFRIFTSEDVNPVWLRNVRWFSDFNAVPPPCPVEARKVLAHVRERKSVPVDDLIAHTEVRSETLWCLLANGKLHADFENSRLWEINGARVHDSFERMLAQRHLRTPRDCPASVAPAVVRLDPHSLVRWCDETWKVLNRNERHLVLQCENADGSVRHLPIADVEELLRLGTLTSATNPLADAIRLAREEKFLTSSPADHREALRRFEAVQFFLTHGSPPDDSSLRSVRRYQQWIAEGEREFGCGFAGLLRRRGRAPGTPGLEESQQRLLDRAVAEFLDRKDLPRATRASSCHARVVSLCHKQGVHPAPSVETVRRALKKQRVAGVAAAQRGEIAGSQLAPPLPRQDASPPVHGDRVHQVGHVDHVEVPVLLVSSNTGVVIGKAWLTVLVDAFSRMPLAFSLSFDAPSRNSLVHVVFDCIRRHHRLPDSVVCDQASEFHSIRVESGFARLSTTKVERPARKPRFGAVLERLFRTANTEMFDELKGSTGLAALNRGLSATHRPERHAVWTLPLLHAACEEWLFNVYPTRVHGNLGSTPKEVFTRSLDRSGERVARFVAYDFSLRISFAQDVDRGGERTVCSSRGIVAGYLRYWHETFERGDVAGTSVPVKLDPLDATIAFAFVRRRWRQCRLLDRDVDLHGRSWKQIEIAVRELRARRQAGRRGKHDEINTRTIGDFLRRMDEVGDLAKQARRDEERLLIQSPQPGADERPQRTVVSSSPAVNRNTDRAPSADGGSLGPATPPEEPFPDDFEDLETFDVD